MRLVSDQTKYGVFFVNVLLIAWLLVSDSENNVPRDMYQGFYIVITIYPCRKINGLIALFISVLNVTLNVIYLPDIVRFYQGSELFRGFMFQA